MRNAFIQELVSLARMHPQIALIVGDLGYSVVEPFADEFPDRFVNAGVAEQNMTGLAAGMASEGYHVFTYSIANFPTFRCAEQIRNDVDYHQLPVTVVSVGGGLSYGALGYSHHAVQDYALMRTFPNMLIAAPGDPNEVRACIRYLVKNPGPSYLRLGKTKEFGLPREVSLVTPGQWLKVKEGHPRRAIITTGACLKLGTDLARRDEFKNYAVFSMPLWSMFDKLSQIDKLAAYEHIVTVEDHLQDGGFGSWLLESKARGAGLNCDVTPIALSQDVCGSVGSEESLLRLCGFSAP